VITHPEYFTYYKNIPIKVNYKKNDALKVQPTVPYKNPRGLCNKFKEKVDYAIRACKVLKKDSRDAEREK
jgi:pyrimidine-specific ribonucleoside hydrolase